MEINLNQQRAKAIDDAIRQAKSYEDPERKLSMREITERLRDLSGVQVSINAVQKWRTTGNIREELMGPLCEILSISIDTLRVENAVHDVDILALINDINELRGDQKYALRLLVTTMLKKI